VLSPVFDNFSSTEDYNKIPLFILRRKNPADSLQKNRGWPALSGGRLLSASPAMSSGDYNRKGSFSRSQSKKLKATRAMVKVVRGEVTISISPALTASRIREGSFSAIT
jgi:hypothetical protein